MNLSPLSFGIIIGIILFFTRWLAGHPLDAALIVSSIAGGVAAWLVLWLYYRFAKKK